MKRRMVKWIVITSVILILATIALYLYHIPTFKGDRIRNPDSYEIVFTHMQGEDSHTLQLREGDVLDVRMERSGGSFSVVIGMAGEEPLYQSNNAGDMAFQLQVPKDGRYVISVNARHAKGMLTIKLV